MVSGCSANPLWSYSKFTLVRVFAYQLQKVIKLSLWERSRGACTTFHADPERVEPGLMGSPKTWEKGPKSVEEEEDWEWDICNIKAALGITEARLASF